MILTEKSIEVNKYIFAKAGQHRNISQVCGFYRNFNLQPLETLLRKHKTYVKILVQMQRFMHNMNRGLLRNWRQRTMRAIIRNIAKYLLWALFIVVVMLYMRNFDILQQAIVLLGGIVVLDVVFAIAGFIQDSAEKHRKNKKKKEKKAAKKTKNADEKTVAEAVKETGNAIIGAAETTWGTIKEKGGEVGSAIKEKLAGGQND